MLRIIKKMFSLSAYLVSIALICGCAENADKFDINLDVASPIDIATSPNGSYFFVLNADYSFQYKTGSILIIDADGNKQGAVLTPRLGRTLTVSGTDLLVTYDSSDTEDETSGLVELYAITELTGKAPTLELQKSFVTPSCTPANAAARPGYPYFAVSCSGGKIFVGELTTDRSQSTLDLVREYGTRVTRRALYLDDKRGLLFAFATDYAEPSVLDNKFHDRHSWDLETGEYTADQPDDSPDELVDKVRDRRIVRERGSSYQYVVYDFTSEAAQRTADGTFILKNWTTHPDVMKKELRWLYFNLTNFGTPDDPVGYTEDDGSKYYRTNFWQASPDPHDPDVFYLSHRGLGLKNFSEHANSIVRVHIADDPRPSSDGTVPLTNSFLKFERVFGFKGTVQLPERTYLGAFQITDLEGHQVVLVNSFHDLVNFEKQRYSLMAASLDEAQAWNVSYYSESLKESLFQFAVASGGRVLVSSFYDNSVILFKLELGKKLVMSQKIY